MLNGKGRRNLISGLLLDLVYPILHLTLRRRFYEEGLVHFGRGKFKSVFLSINSGNHFASGKRDKVDGLWILGWVRS